METAETRSKLANAIRTLQASGDTTSIDGLVSAYKRKYQSQNNTPNEPQPFAVPTTQQDKQANYQNAIANAEKAKLEANASGGILNIGANTLGNVGKTLASSEVALGQTIAKTFGNQSASYADTIGKLNQTQGQLLGLIKKYEKEGRDATNLKRAYNQNIQQLKDAGANLNEEANLPTTGQVVGQIGGTALDLLTAGTYGKATLPIKTNLTKEALKQSLKIAPNTLSTVAKSSIASGLPELSKIAGQKASGLFTKQGIKNVGKGAGIGYGYDVSMGLQGARGEDRTGGKAFIPGLGTAIGMGIPAISEGVQQVKNFRNPVLKTEKVVATNNKQLGQVVQNNATLRKIAEKNKARGYNTIDDLANTDLLVNSVDNTGTMRTVDAVDELNQIIKPAEDVISTNLTKEGRKLPVSYVEKLLKKSVQDSSLEGEALTNALNKIDKEVAGYKLRADADGYISLAKIHDAKVNKYATVDYLNPASKQADKTIAKTLKEIVEKNTKSVDVQKVNRELGRFYAMQSLLEKMDGKKVQGAKLGKYFAQTVGGMVGSHFGPIGTIVGAELGGRIRGDLLSRTLSGKTEKIPVRSQVLESAIESGKPNPTIELPQSKSNNLGNLNTSQSTTISPTMNVIPKTLPQNKSIINKVVENYKNIPNKQGGFIKTGVSQAGKDLTKLDPTEIGSLTKDEIAKGEGLRFGKLEEKRLSNLPADVQMEAFTDKSVRKSDINNLTVYRVVPKGKSIGNGDFVFDNLPQAEKYLKQYPNRGSEIVSIKGVKPEDLLVAGKKGQYGDWNVEKGEFVYLPKQTDNISTDLLQEAKKYKSAEEFVKAQGTPVYHGTDANFTEFDIKKSGSKGFETKFENAIYVSPNKNFVKQYGKNTIDGVISPEARIIDYDKIKYEKGYDDFFEKLAKGNYTARPELMNAKEAYAKQNFDVIKYGENEYVVINPNVLKTKSQLTDIWNKANKTSIPTNKGFISTGYKETGNLTTKILKDLEGKSTVSKQYILDATNRGELKQVERDITRQILDTMPNGQINVQEFADKVKSELLPLKVKTSPKTNKMASDGFRVAERGQKYESITLPDDLRGNVKNYSENIYESPIKTNAGQTHFAGQSENYFGHTRIEDMADNKTRRVIEVQSDLYQKGNLEREGVSMAGLTKKELQSGLSKQEYDELISLKAKYTTEKNVDARLALERRQYELLEKAQANAPRTKEVAKLQQYNDPTAHFRMIREEIKKAAEDGKTKLQFPTGDTAMKIEGLGSAESWNFSNDLRTRPTPDNIKIGDEMVQGADFGDFAGNDSWIITEVLDNGKFKAVPRNNLDFVEEQLVELGYPGPDDAINAIAEGDKRVIDLLEDGQGFEQFDISGKIDTNNPIYKFYEKEVQKYLNKFGGKRVVDDKGVSWIELPITGAQGKAPVEAFGKIAKNPLMIGAGVLGTGVIGAKIMSDKKKANLPKRK